jgi:phosphomannomutase/phosphoglucomutase
MLPKPQTAAPAKPDVPFVKPTGFREYDARWLLDKEINLPGIEALGLGLGTLFHELGVRPDVAVAHDYRSYSEDVKKALIKGLVAAGARVHDVGLAVTPMAYFAQFALDLPCVAMVTASHNDNGWTGVKMGAGRPLTFGPDEMTRLKEIVLGGGYKERPGGSHKVIPDFAARYLADLASHPKIKRKLKVVVACGNGTAGAFAPQALAALGCEVVPLDCELDWTFPKYNPNTEDLKMLHAVRDEVLRTGADVGLAFDGDGDRCGVVDDRGEEIFADKVGVMLARDLSARINNATFVVDVKSTGLFATDPVLKANGVKADYWKTGHSYIKRRVAELKAVAGFEKSGHFFFNPPVGRGYDDGLVSAFAVCDLLDRNPGKKMSDLLQALPKTWGSPTMAPHCPDEVKYRVVDALVRRITEMKENGEPLAGQKIRELVTVNGGRVTLADGTWGLVRASSNKPELVVVVESPVSEARMRAMFRALDALIREHPEVGAYNQTI